MNAPTAEGIRQIAAQCRFRPTTVARSLVTRRIHTIGMVVASIVDPFVAEVVSGIEEEPGAHGYSLFLAECSADPEREVKVLQSFEERVEDIMVAALRVGALHTLPLERMRIAMVLLNAGSCAT